MGDDFYCEEALSGRTPITVVRETDEVLAFHHTRPFWTRSIFTFT
jgi:histidine triad (HIT) family protein